MRILSGIQPTGTPHIGNYFGMMKPAIELQEQGDSFIFIADYHSLTSTPNPEQLRENIFNVAVNFLACGLDPNKTVFFRQSDVPQVTELAWILSCSASMGLLERAHSYKDKLANGITPNVGLFSYPILMAADILLYHSEIVPVGKDQKQHLEIARDIAQSFNHRYGEELLTIPKEQIKESGSLIPGIDGRKMSKSYNNTIEILGSKKATRKTIMKIKTDSKELEDVKDPENCNIVALYKLFATEQEVEELSDKYRAGGFGYGHAKQALFEKMWDYFEPFRQKRDELIADKEYVESVLQDGAKRASAVADETISKIRKTIGLMR